MTLIILLGLALAAVSLSIAVYRWFHGYRNRPPQDLTIEEYRRVHETASSRHRSNR